VSEPRIIIKANGLIVMETTPRSLLVMDAYRRPPNAPAPLIAPGAVLSLEIDAGDGILRWFDAGTMRDPYEGEE